MKIRQIPLLLICLALGACASSTPIQRYSESQSKFNPPTQVMSTTIPQKDWYRLHVRAATGFVPISACREDAVDRAKQFCELQGKGMVILGEKTSSPILYPGNFPRIEIIFANVDKK